MGSWQFSINRRNVLAALSIPIAAVGVPMVMASPGAALENSSAVVASKDSAEVPTVEIELPARLKTAGDIPVGKVPQNVTVLPDGKHAYVTNSSSKSVSVIDTATKAVVKTIPVGSVPLWMAASPDGSLLYVTNNGANGDDGVGTTVSVIDTATDTVTKTLTSGKGPIGIVVSPDGARAYVVNYTDGTVSVIDTAHGSTEATVSVGAGPMMAAITPDGSRLYVTTSSDKVSVIDTATNTVTGSVEVGKNPQGVVISPDGRYAYVANQSSNTVSVIDTATDTVTSVLPAGNQPSALALTPWADHLIVTNNSSTPDEPSSVSVLDTFTGELVKGSSITTGKGPYGAAVTESGTLFVANTISNTVTAAQLPQSMVGNAKGVSTSFDRKIAVSSNIVESTASIFGISAEGPDAGRDVSTGRSPSAVTTSSDGKRAYVANRAD
ncbi:beta-propeller fold lactonase family protein, partial [Kitasatospora sp. MBT63]